MVFDPAWDMPQLNWLQQGSFEPGSIPPVVEPDAGTQVWLGPVAQEWLPWICGALDQGRNPSSWIVADDTAMHSVLRRWDTLMGLLCGNGGSQMPVMLRFNFCVLQTSSDGGVTWQDVPGWVAGFANCVRDSLPPPPPPIGPGPIQQHACNLAGYLAVKFIQESFILAVAAFDANLSYLELASNISQTILSEALPLANLFVQAVYDFYKLYTAGTIAAFRAASTDVGLWSAVTCAIFEAIKNDGAVTDGNYPQVAANICALVYVPPSIVTALCNYVSTLGGVNVRAIQVAGALDVVDCAGCGTWCVEANMTVSSNGWVPYLVPGGFWTGGVGWTAQYRAADDTTSINITWSFGLTTSITTVHVGLLTTVLNINGDFILQLFAGGVHVTEWSWTAIPDGAEHDYVAGPGPPNTGDQLYFAFEASGNVLPSVLKYIRFEGPGINPFGPDSCPH